MGEFKRTITIQTEIDRSSISKSEKVISNFLNKYNDKSIKVDTSEFSMAAQEIKVLGQELNRIESNSANRHLLPTIAQDKEYLDEIKSELHDITAVFTDGTITKGFGDTFSKIFSGAQLAAVDLGDYVSSIHSQISELNEELYNLRNSRNARYPDIDYDDMLGGVHDDNDKYFGGILDIDDLYRQKEVLEETLSLMQEANVFDSNKYSKRTIGDLETRLHNTEWAIGQMEKLNLETTEQLTLRKRIAELSRESEYGNGDIQDAKSNIENDKDYYNREIAVINEYIENKRRAIELAREYEYDLFNGDASDVISDAQSGIKYLENAKVELTDFYNKLYGKGQGEVGDINLTPVVESLEELKQVISSIKDSLDPISELFQNESNAMAQMAESGASSFTSLSEAVNAFYNDLLKVGAAVDEVSKKDFNITNLSQTLTQEKDPTVDYIQSYRDAATTIYNQLSGQIGQELFSNMHRVQDQNLKTRISKYAGDFYHFDDMFPKSDLRASSLSKIQEVYERLSKFRNGILSLIQEINSAQPGLIAEKWSDIIDPKAAVDEAITERKKLAELSKEPTADEQGVSANVSGIEELIQALRNLTASFEPINTALTTSGTLLNQMATEGALSLDALTQKLGEVLALTQKISGEDVAVVDEGGIQSATNAIIQEGEAAEAAASKKGEFVNANVAAAESGIKTAEGAKIAAEGMNEEAAAAEALDKRSRIFKAGEDDPSRIIEESSGRTKNSYRKVTKHYKVNDDGEYDLNTVQITDDFKKVQIEAEKAEQAALKAIKAQDTYISQKNKNISTLSSALDPNANRTLVGTEYEAEARNKIQAIRDEVAKLDEVLEDGSRKIFSEEELNAEKKKVEELVRDAGDFIKTSRNKEYAPIAFDSQRVSGNLKERENSLTLFVNSLRQAGVLTGELEADTVRLGESLKNVKTNGDLKEYLYQLKEIRAKSKLAIQQKKDEDAMWAEYNKGYTEEDIKKQEEQSWKEYHAQNAAAAREEVAAKKELAQVQREVAAFEAEEAEVSRKKSVKLSDLDQQVASWKKNGQYTEDVKNKVDELKTSLTNLTSSNQLKDWNAAWHNLKNEVKQTKDELDEVTKKNKQNANYGKATFNGATKKYDNTVARYDAFDNGEFSPQLIGAFDSYIKKYEELAAARARFNNDPSLANNQNEKNAFNQMAQDTEKARKEVEEYLNSMERLARAKEEGTLLGKPEEFKSDGINSATDALREYANTLFQGKLQITGWNDAGTEMYGTLNKGKGVIDNVTVSLDQATNAMYAYRTSTKEVGTAWERFKAGVGKKAGEISNYILGAGSIYQGIAEVRKGVQYVTEIDTALTELKKVTDETDTTYSQFLNTMSQTGSKIGATVKDLTTMSADWARLGYSIEEAGKLAESTAILLNVSEFTSAEDANEALISSMQAFGIAAEDSMGVVDILNEVGNNFAISSDGIAVALQDSASSLMAAGNTLEQSVAMIAAANKVVNLCHVVIVI